MQGRVPNGQTEQSSAGEDSPQASGSATDAAQGDATPTSETQSAGETNRALALLAEYEVRLKAIYQKHNPDALSDDPHLDQILGKYREQMISRPAEANQPQVLQRYRERGWRASTKPSLPAMQKKRRISRRCTRGISRPSTGSTTPPSWQKLTS
ncbi:unnamed protein product [Effrenium voratum]|nr:unnamed protein product [Effrenium voratum]